MKPIKFSSLFQGSDSNAIQILEATLKFDPAKRPSLDQIMKNPFFKDLYKEDELEQLRNAEPVIMELEFEKELSIEILKQYFDEEFKFY